MRRTKRGTQKRSQLAKEAQEGTTRIEQLYQERSHDWIESDWPVGW